MPAAEIRRRGGATRVRTKRLPDGRYVHIYVVRGAGPRGGHTVAGEVKKAKPDSKPTYRMKPDLPKRRSKTRAKPR